LLQPKRSSEEAAAKLQEALQAAAKAGEQPPGGIKEFMRGTWGNYVQTRGERKTHVRMFANVMDKLRIIGELRSSNCDCDWLLHVTPVHQSHATCTPVVFKFLRQLTNRLSFSVPG